MNPRGLALALLVFGVASPALADVKPVAARVGVDEHIGAAVPLDLPLTDHHGRKRVLGDVIGRDKPVVLSLAYYHCPGLCDVVLRELATRLRELGWELGSDYRALTVSIDPHDTPATAAAKRSNVVGLLRSPKALASADGWTFAVASEPTIQQLAAALGYRYDYDAPTRQYAHPAVGIVLTPSGTVARYLYGPTFDVRSLGLALREAREGRGGATAWVDRTVLACFRYDPTTQRYEWVVLSVMRGGAALIALSLAVTIAIFIRRGRARRAEV
jgi:protein SCO1/2